MSRPPCPPVKSAEITPEALYLNRREFLSRAGLLAAGVAGLATLPGLAAEAPATVPPALPGKRNAEFSVSERPNPWHDITTYNNFYEFSTGKAAVAKLAHTLKPRPWTITVDGACHKPLEIGIEDLLKRFPLEERVYRFRCVEAWSMVVPWVGFPLASLLDLVEPQGSARFVEFTTLHDVKQMPNQKWDYLKWPYREGLRLDEARHPLTMLVVGLYGKVLPNQNGAPLRLIVPWKYGFKSGKSLVRIRLTEQQPVTTWNQIAPDEYGFYANVNPEVPHPRWTQATERRLGAHQRQPTLPFNGYAEQVAGLYTGMNLRREF